MGMILGSEEFDFRFEVGICEVRLEDRPRIVQLIANYFTVVRVKAQMIRFWMDLMCWS